MDEYLNVIQLTGIHDSPDKLENIIGGGREAYLINGSSWRNILGIVDILEKKMKFLIIENGSTGI
ncbi:hypothetical protein LOAG_14725 [Loa loa]|uniref:Uncharacterized protein n=1 Tax=Loa loa TaxID=7209 RepID=A0A1S0TH82_LOALO|nr:hypothetical protein LOAG_14725 [Loa loa]EFO13802.2 hypothetical protein LOAG_14725 [Loa loa]